MERNFYDTDDFEEFLKQKADQYKMYPSDRVWNNIHRSLHRGPSKIGIVLTALLVGSALFMGKESAVTLKQAAENIPAQAAPVPSALNQVPGNSLARLANRQSSRTGNTMATGGNPLMPAIVHANTATAPINRIHPDQPEEIAYDEVTVDIINRSTPSKTAWVNAGAFKKAVVAVKADRLPALAGTAAATTPAQKKQDIAAITHDAAEQPGLKPSRWSVQLFSSPMISYRRLTDNQPVSAPPVSNNYAGNVNHYVHHQPAPGFEFGAKLAYQLSDNLRIYAGAQFNYSRYFIDAYKSNTEKVSIAPGNRDTLSGYTNIRNFSGFAPEQLQNQYWQISIPVGLEIKLLGNKNVSLNVAGGVQPTFLVSSNAYLLSSDYKNYIQSPDLGRAFNVHTSFDLFVSFKAGGVQWNLGPQFRSQLLSSYSNQYRVKEYLTEYGFKLAISRPLHW